MWASEFPVQSYFAWKSVPAEIIFDYKWGTESTSPYSLEKKQTKKDLKIWEKFLSHPTAYCRPFFHFDSNLTTKDINMYTDAAKSLGCGGFCDSEWFMVEWEEKFMAKYQPSINYLELYGVTVAVVNWIHRFKNQKVSLFCDNMSVVHMINRSSSKCLNCMELLRIITFQGLIHNVQITAKHVPGVQNNFADLMSRLKYKEFRKLSRETKTYFKGKPTQYQTICGPWIRCGSKYNHMLYCSWKKTKH